MSDEIDNDPGNDDYDVCPHGLTFDEGCSFCDEDDDEEDLDELGGEGGGA